MSISLSLRQKLIAVLILVCVGFAGFGFYAIMNFQQMQNASLKANRIADSYANLSNLEVTLLKFERQAANPTPTNMDRLYQELEPLSQQNLVRDALENPYLDSQAKQDMQTLAESLPNYLTSLKQFLDIKQSLGADNQSGALFALNEQANDAQQQLSILAQFASTFKDVRAKEKDFLAAPSQDKLDVWNSFIDRLLKQINDIGFGEDFNPVIESYRALVNQVSSLSLSLQQISQHLESVREQNSATMRQVTEYLKSPLLETAQLQVHETAIEARRNLIIGGVALTLLIGAIISMLIYTLSQKIQTILKRLQKVANGKLTHHSDRNLNHKDELDQILLTSNTMTTNLSQLVTQLRDSNQVLVETADHLSDDAFTIVSSSEQIRDRSNTLATATEEISHTSAEVSNMTQQVNDAANNAHQSAQSGAQVIGNAIDAIQAVASSIEQTHISVSQLGERSKEIDSVIDLIVGVAEQTNLLALNAAIEAARAGEAGRGFAVVADEVRTLAEQTVKATSSITSKIEGIQQETQNVISAMATSLEQVATGKEKGEAAVSTIKEVEALTLDAAEQTQSISASIQEVVLTTQAMAKDMDDIAKSIEHNYHATQNIKASGQDIHGHASRLTQQIAQFEIK
ncbi:MAG: hypothetical protein HWE24_10095 [Oceanospirillaceae bacterium]|nr:hypothetical protein [Oceanospirillaceae bacterium]